VGLALGACLASLLTRVAALAATNRGSGADSLVAATGGFVLFTASELSYCSRSIDVRLEAERIDTLRVFLTFASRQMAVAAPRSSSLSRRQS
jgi:hypothetical protein